MPFTQSSLIAVADDGSIYTAWSSKFLIKVYGPDGGYRRAFYYPYHNAPLHIQKMDIPDYHKQCFTNNNVPATWPALHTMFFDGKGRLWVFTITGSKTHYKGWVLNKNGKLLARFNWPGRRASQNVNSKPMLLVKNGYLYEVEINIRKGLNQVVKYEIHFKKN